MVIGITAWLLVCASGHAARGFLEAGVAWCWSGVALIVAAGVVLGETGGFGQVGFFSVHLAVLLVALMGRRRLLSDDARAWRRAMNQARDFFNQPGLDRFLGMGLVLVIAILTAIAACSEVAGVDALTYHLPRMAHWLQDGRISVLDSADARLNFVAMLPELVGAWLLGATTEGFRLVVLTQAIGGIMAVGATIGLARYTGLTRGGALLAGALLLGMANVVVQFTSGQTDLFTLGAFAAAFFLWVSALRKRAVSVPGLLGAGLALGAKGTLFYLAPGALMWVVALAWRHPLSPRQWLRSLCLALAGGLFFAGPAFWRNWRAYGDALGPREWVQKHHRGFKSAADLGAKIRLNLSASLAQDLAPGSQPHLLRDPMRTLGTKLVATFPERDDYTLDGLSRRESVTGLLQQRAPDADTVSFGAVATVLFIGGIVVAVVLVHRRREAGTVLMWSGGVIGFGLFFHAMHQWHPFAFRYLTLAAPWIAIVGAWGLEQLRAPWRAVAWIIAMAAAMDVAWVATTQTPQAGWPMVERPERMFDYFLTLRWRQWSEQLDATDAPFAIALPEERPLAAFYRQHPARKVTFVPKAGVRAATSEELTQGQAGWTIVPAARFIGHEGRVAARTWLLAGDPMLPGSIAAYRRLRPGETPTPVLYRHTRSVGPGEIRYDLSIKTWDAGPVHLVVANPADSECEYVVSAGVQRITGQLGGATTREIAVELPANAVTDTNVIFHVPRVSRDPGTAPVVYLRAP